MIVIDELIVILNKLNDSRVVMIENVVENLIVVSKTDPIDDREILIYFVYIVSDKNNFRDVIKSIGGSLIVHCNWTFIGFIRLTIVKRDSSNFNDEDGQDGTVELVLNVMVDFIIAMDVTGF